MPIESKTGRQQKWTLNPYSKKIAMTKAAAIYIERINYFLKHPPDTNWNGVWIMKGK